MKGDRPGDWRWITDAVVFAIHDRQIAEHGGKDGLRDEQTIRSACDWQIRSTSAPGQALRKSLLLTFSMDCLGRGIGVALEAIRQVIPRSEVIDLMVLNHADRDHIGGAPAILGAYQVNRILRPGEKATTVQDDHIDIVITTEGDLTVGYSQPNPPPGKSCNQSPFFDRLTITRQPQAEAENGRMIPADKIRCCRAETGTRAIFGSGTRRCAAD